MSKNKLFLILWVLLITTVCFAEDRYVFICENGGALNYFDSETIKYTYNEALDTQYVDVWIITIYASKNIELFTQQLKDSGFPESYLSQAIEIYQRVDFELGHFLIAKNKICGLYLAAYDQEGQIIVSGDLDGRWLDCLPGSIGEYWYQKIMEYATSHDELLKSRSFKSRKTI